jgi:hypothetical protein
VSKSGLRLSFAILGVVTVDPRLLLVAELLLAPVGVAVVLLLLFEIVRFVLSVRQRRHFPQPPSSVRDSTIA